MTAGALPQTCGAAPPPVAWIRPGKVGYIGPDLGVDLHATSVAVLSVGLDAPFTLETAGHGATTARSAYAPARTTHRVVAREGRILLLLIDPAGPPAVRVAAALQRYTGPYGLDHRLEGELVAACGHGGDLDSLRSLAGPPVRGTTDRRISRLVDDIRADPGQAFRADETASRLGLSTSHFLRLFAQHTGTTFRRYQQWARILRAVRGMVAGHDLTRCAADAGFASPSHFSDTFHRTFGLSPTALLSSRVQAEASDVTPGGPPAAVPGGRCPPAAPAPAPRRSPPGAAPARPRARSPGPDRRWHGRRSGRPG
jgi:AraC-like DNA-binding protein